MCGNTFYLLNHVWSLSCLQYKCYIDEQCMNIVTVWHLTSSYNLTVNLILGPESIRLQGHGDDMTRKTFRKNLQGFASLRAPGCRAASLVLHNLAALGCQPCRALGLVAYAYCGLKRRFVHTSTLHRHFVLRFRSRKMVGWFLAELKISGLACYWLLLHAWNISKLSNLSEFRICFNVMLVTIVDALFGEDLWFERSRLPLRSAWHFQTVSQLQRWIRWLLSGGTQASPTE